MCFCFFSGKCPTVCPFLYDVKCGTDGKNYDNECMMRKMTCQSGGQVNKAYDGECGMKIYTFINYKLKLKKLFQIMGKTTFHKYSALIQYSI